MAIANIWEAAGNSLFYWLRDPTSVSCSRLTPKVEREKRGDLAIVNIDALVFPGDGRSAAKFWSAATS
jgi:hypothetical protein